MFDGNGPDLNECMLMVVIFPMSFVAVPIAFVVTMPLFVIPIVVPAILVSSDRERGSNYSPRARMDRNNVFISILRRQGKAGYSRLALADTGD